MEIHSTIRVKQEIMVIIIIITIILSASILHFLDPLMMCDDGGYSLI